MIKSAIMNRKLGAFELLLADIPFELFVQMSVARALLAALLCGAFFAAKQKFNGEFSLSDLAKYLDNSQDPQGGDKKN